MSQEVPARFREISVEIGKILRLLRMKSGLSGRDLASSIGMSQAKISRLENGQFLPSSEDLTAVIDFFNLPQDQANDLLGKIQDLNTKIIDWRSYNKSGFSLSQQQLLDQENSVIDLRLFQSVVIPGLLQTADYAKQTFKKFFVDMPDDDLSESVSGRMQRQHILFQEKRQFHFIISEAVLHMHLCNISSTRAQFDRLMSLSTLENVRLGIIPFHQELSFVPLNAFTIYDQNIVVVESYAREVTYVDPADVVEHIKIFNYLTNDAKYDQAALDIINNAKSNI